MQKLLQLFLALLIGAMVNTASAQKLVDMGTLDVSGGSAVAVRVSGSTTELNSLANTAFTAHGYYRVSTTSGVFDIRFASAGANQVNVQVSKGTSVVLNQTATGSSVRNAFFRAADAAVKATSGLNGFFASKLAFVSNRTGKDEIYVSDLFFGEMKQITNDRAFAMTPRWSPDGTRLIYTSFFKSGFPDIYLLNLATMRRDTFVSVQGTNSGARFSPNGQQVVMVLSGYGTPEISVSPVSGRPISRLTFSEAVKSSPCFSPDGAQIVFASEPGPQLYVMLAQSRSPARRITNSGFSTYCAEPDWSRGDPSKIAFTFRKDGQFQVAVLDQKTGKSEQVSKAPYDGVEPCWLADGRHLMYTARAAGTRSLAILDTVTGHTYRLTGVPAEKASVVGP